MKEFLKKLNAARLRSYDADPGLLKEHFGIEETVLAGGYGYRQVLELVQNGADALLEACECGGVSEDKNRIHVLLRDRRLYVANTGAPLSEDGLDALLRSHSSPKRGNQIGRFGLGFKSLLKLSGQIDLFTRDSGAIRFDPRRCRAELRERYEVTNAPGLRLAWPLGDEERRTDPTCTDLAWAETIVRAKICTEDLVDRIRDEIRSFPAEFLLFFPVATTILLDDGKKPAREVRIEHDAGGHVLYDGGSVSRWRVATREVHIRDTDALKDATSIHGRETVPLAWAVPVQGRREEAGRFWAFYPTRTQTYVPGIVNAPWKLNTDRNAVIGGEWNTALMAEAAHLIVESLPRLSTSDDPGRPLDAFPRQMERQDEVAAPLVEDIWEQLGNANVIPDATGRLRAAQELLRHPTDISVLVADWQSLAAQRALGRFVHSTCMERQRASRLNALAERLESSGEDEDSPALRLSSEKAWFGFAATTEASEALKVLRLAEKFSEKINSYDWNRIRSQLAIIPTGSADLVAAPNAVLAPADVSVPGRAAVSAELSATSEARRILIHVLGVKEPDSALWTELLDEALGWYDEGWEKFWTILRLSPDSVRYDFLAKNAHRVRVRRRDDGWAHFYEVLLPGYLVAAEDPTQNRYLLVDEEYHADDRPSLDAIGVSELPQGDFPCTDQLYEWCEACRSLYKRTYNNAARRDFLEPLSSFAMPRCYGLLNDLTGIPNSKLTLHLLKRLHESTFQQRVRFGHSTTAAYSKIAVQHPLPWYLLSKGTVQFGSATAPLAAIVSRQNETALSRVPEMDHLSSSFEQLNAAFPSVKSSTAGLQTLWLAVMSTLVTEDAIANDALTELWVSAAKDGIVPVELPGSSGMVPISDVFVTTSIDLARRARIDGHVVVTLDGPTMQSWVQAGAQDLSNLIEVSWADSAGPPERLITVFPDLQDALTGAARDTARCQSVVGLQMCIGEITRHVPCVMSDGVLQFDGEQLASLARVKRLRALLAEISAAGWLDGSPDEALRRLGDSQVDERRAHVAAGDTLAERLLRAVGDRVEPLREALGDPVSHMGFVLECGPLQLAELTLAQLGPTALTVLRGTLEAEGLKPPGRWNTADALTFVASIGFPPEFASSAQARRDPDELISGPIELPPLHDFQKGVLDGLQSLLLARGTGRRRAVVSLPTGGGKTRVTVEAAVRLVLAPKSPNRSVVWIAQTDELCEQAVQAFRQVWVNLGARHTDLRAVRLWGGNPNPAGQELDRPIVVVASIQTLNSRFGAPPLDWLRKPGLVVVDECHHAITPSYSALLRWLDAEAPRQETADKDEPPIVGLSATPFRTDDDESQRLARRFDSRWLPSNQEHLYSRLRRQDVLAEARYEPLYSDIGLTDQELTDLGRLGDQWEGLDFENLLEAINQRLAGDTHRNEQLLECIRASGERSILFFTNSVSHAGEMSARLNLAGIRAAAISGSTPRVARRYFLDRFQQRDVRVLCNHSVLTTGFDAPKTDMILIARQVFSPVRYMQMVGRGCEERKTVVRRPAGS